MKNCTKALLRSRRGITMVEVVVGLVIISIISISALSLILRSVNVEKQSFSVIEAEYAAENTLACFRYAQTQEEFVQAMCQTAPYELQEDGSLLLARNGCTVTVLADYATRSFAYTAVDPNGVVIYSFHYPRNAGGAP